MTHDRARLEALIQVGKEDPSAVFEELAQMATELLDEREAFEGHGLTRPVRFLEGLRALCASHGVTWFWIDPYVTDGCLHTLRVRFLEENQTHRIQSAHDLLKTPTKGG